MEPILWSGNRLLPPFQAALALQVLQLHYNLHGYKTRIMDAAKQENKLPKKKRQLKIDKVTAKRKLAITDIICNDGYAGD